MKTKPDWTTRTLMVEGRTWSGAEGTHEYPLKEGQDPTTLAEAKQIAGDFEFLTHAKVVTTQVWHSEKRSYKTLK